MSDAQFMRLALRLARRGHGATSPATIRNVFAEAWFSRKNGIMKMILKLNLVLLLAVVANGCSTTGGNASSSPAPTVSGSISTGVSTDF